jgi:hypothetical protein
VTISYADAKQALETLVAERGPDYVYRPPVPAEPDGMTGMCVNVHKDADGNLVEGCLAGAALHRLGVPLEDLRDHNASGVSSVVDCLNIDIAESAVQLLGWAQRNQDQGVPWGVALSLALRAVEDNG